MVDSVALFFALGTQWRWTGAGLAGAFRTGIDYAVFDSTRKNLGIKRSPQLFSDVRLMEAEALSVWSRKH